MARSILRCCCGFTARYDDLVGMVQTNCTDFNFLGKLTSGIVLGLWFAGRTNPFLDMDKVDKAVLFNAT